MEHACHQNVFHSLQWWRVLWWCLLFKPKATMVQPLTDATRFQHTDFQHANVRNIRPRWAAGPPNKQNIPHALPSFWNHWEQTGRWNEQNWAADSLFALAQEFKALNDDEDDGMRLRDDISWRKHRTSSPAEVLPSTARPSFLRPPAVWLFPHTSVADAATVLLLLKLLLPLMPPLLLCCCVPVEPKNNTTQTKCLFSTWWL